MFWLSQFSAGKAGMLSHYRGKYFFSMSLTLAPDGGPADVIILY